MPPGLITMRPTVPEPPRGTARLPWYGPGLLWMVTAVGSGSVLFSPRIGAAYGYDLLWAALVVVFFVWIIISEVGRYTVVTGKTLLRGYRELPGPRDWAVWLIVLPQSVGAVVTVAGIAALVGSVLMLALPGDQLFYSPAVVLVSAAIVVAGKYQGVERMATLMAIVLAGASIAAATAVFPGLREPGAGVVPGLPPEPDAYMILPWLGFVLAGAAGILWYSYWVAGRGYGGEAFDPTAAGEDEADAASAQPYDERVRFTASWVTIMKTTAAIGVLGAGTVSIAFLALGAELLRPEGVIPEGIDVAEDLGLLLSEIWGDVGLWILIVSVGVALWGTILGNQDGWGRTFADATLLLLPRRVRQRGERARPPAESSEAKQPVAVVAPAPVESIVSNPWLLLDRPTLQRVFTLVLATLLPLVVFFSLRDPVAILSIAGIIGASHIPVIVFLTLYLNRKTLPPELQPGRFTTTAMAIAGVFFSGFGVFYFLDLFGVEIL